MTEIRGITESGIKAFLCENIDKSLIRGEWGKWLRSLELYLAAEEITNKKKKRDKLLHLGGIQLQEVAFNLPGAIETYDSKQDNDVFQILVDKLTQYFSPKQNSVFERHIFRTLKPEEGETFNKFLLKIRQQATKCTFGKDEKEATEINMIDKVIDHWASHDLKKKLLEKERTLDETIELCQIYEQIGNQTTIMDRPQTSESATAQVNKISFQKKRVSIQCTRCGQPGHADDAQDCPARNSKCRRCNLQGHFAARCRTNLKRKIETNKSKDNSNNNKRDN